MLCGYYYSQMERTHLSEISEDPDSLLLRWVDDFLFITPEKSLADKFLNVMHAGIPEYGCFINHDKTLTNYVVIAADGREVKRIGASERFPWCGFLLDTVTLEVSPDLSRYTGECNYNVCFLLLFRSQRSCSDQLDIRRLAMPISLYDARPRYIMVRLAQGRPYSDLQMKYFESEDL